MRSSVEVAESISSTSANLLTPSSSTASRPTYADQHNITPSPEPRQRAAGRDQAGDAEGTNTSSDCHCITNSFVLAAPDLLALGVARLNVQSPVQSTITSLVLTPEDDDESVYSMRREPLPDAPIYNRELQAVLGDVKTQLGELESSMAKCAIVSENKSSLYALHEQTRSLSQFEYPTTRTIGFVGGSGVGENNALRGGDEV